MATERGHSELPFLRNVGLVVTYRCQVSCPHCVLEAGPQRRTQVDLDHASEWIEQIARYRQGHVKFLSLTGGEPFVNLERLRKISEVASAKGLRVSAVTNAFWARSAGVALDVLRRVPAVEMLGISCDAYHQEQIPFERVRFAVEAARSCGRPFNVAVCTQDFSDPAYLELREKLAAFVSPDLVNAITTVPVGRALARLERSRYRLSPTPPVSACSSGGSPILFPNGNVIACIGPVIDLHARHPLLLGNLNEEPLEAILDRADSNPILHAIRVWGPHRLYALLKRAGYESSLPAEYLEGSVCDACYLLMTHAKLRGYLEELARDDEFVLEVAYARSFYLKEVPALLRERGLATPARGSSP